MTNSIRQVVAANLNPGDGAIDAGAMGKITALETKIAATHATRADSNDLEKGNNPWARADFATKAPGLDWSTYFTAAAGSSSHVLAPWVEVFHPSTSS